MGLCIVKMEHECGSSDGLQVFRSNTGGYNGYCFACDTFVPNPYSDRPVGYAPEAVKLSKSPEQVKAELEEIGGLPVVDLPERKLEAWALDYFGIKIGLSEQDGSTPVLHYYPYTSKGKLTGFKGRLIASKAMWMVGSAKEADLFGWERAIQTGSKRLIIVEGELDAVSVYQALKKKSRGSQWEHYDPAVVSLRNGASGVRKDLSRQAADIRAHFKEVVLAFDRDKAGLKATEEGMQVLPNARAVELPCKDANECLIQGKAMALCNTVLFKASTPKNTRLVWGPSLYEDGRKQAEPGLSWPWEGMTQLTRGLRFGETLYLGAGVKMGKSELVNSLASHLMINHGMKVFLAKPEETNRKTYQLVLGKVAGRIFHDPNIEFDYDAYDKASQEVGDKLCMLNLYQHLGWNSLRADIVEAVEAGCQAVFIDPITNLTNGVASGDANTMLQGIAQELAAMAKDLNIMVFIFCHLKAPETGPPHERGGKVLSHQFSGSRAMMRSCNMMLGLEGSKDPDLPPEERNVRKLIILEDREFGVTGQVRLYWDKNTSLFNEIKEG